MAGGPSGLEEPGFDECFEPLWRTMGEPHLPTCGRVRVRVYGKPEMEPHVYVPRTCMRMISS